MERFVWGLLAGVGGGILTWGLSDHAIWGVSVGLCLAILVWFGEFIDELLPW